MPKIVERDDRGFVKRVYFESKGKSMTDQQEVKASDLSTIVKRFIKSGQSVPLMVSDPENYGEFDQSQTYHDAVNIALYAEEQFKSLPSKVRERFRNRPAELLAFVNDEKNRDEAIALGLIAKPKPEVIQKVEVVNAPKAS